jgi:hypothetical protein
MGFWSAVSEQVDEEERASIRTEHTWDLISCVAALIGFFLFFLAPMYLLIREYGLAIGSFAGVAVCCGVLYFTWYRRMAPSEEEADEEADS